MIEMARSLLKEMQLSCQFWGEAIRHTIYLLNRLPTRSVTGVTPYEAWSGCKPHIGHIHVFGCVAHMRVLGVNMNKLDDRSRAMVHLGKEPGTKVYRLYDPVNKRVCVSRDVVFEESRLWSWNKDKATQTSDTFVVFGLGSAETVGENMQDYVDDNDAGSSVESDQESNSETSIDSSHTSSSSAGNVESESSREAQNYRTLTNIYANTEEVELEDDELFFVAADEPTSYKQASKEQS